MAADVVRRCGGAADAETLLPLFLSAPEVHGCLVPVFARHGDVRLAERLWEATVEGGRLREGVPAEVLLAVGRLGYEPAAPALWEYVGGMHDEAKNACLGLLHLPCDDLRGEIAEALEKHEGSGLFPEFLPVLAPKTGDGRWLDRLAAWGKESASVDCNGGLILGIALCGERSGARARAAFTRLLWDADWEACGTGTGSALWTYAGTRVLGLGLPELYADLRARLRASAGTGDPRELEYAFRSLVTLLELRAEDVWTGVEAAETPAESCDELYGRLFTPAPDDEDTLTDFVERVADDDGHLVRETRAVEAALRAAAAHEWEIRAATSR